MDRAPYPAKSEREAEGENVGHDDGQPGKMTGRRAERVRPNGELPNPTQSQSAKMRDEGVRVRTPTIKTDPRPSERYGVGHEGEGAGALDLSTAQRAEIWKQLGNQQATNAPPGFEPKVGATVPASMQLRSLPNSVSSEVPQVQSYNYAMVHSQLLIVDPATNRIVSIITE